VSNGNVHRAKPMIAQSALSPSSPTPPARRYAACRSRLELAENVGHDLLAKLAQCLVDHLDDEVLLLQHLRPQRFCLTLGQREGLAGKVAAQL
jgi:hypothetical protein